MSRADRADLSGSFAAGVNRDLRSTTDKRQLPLSAPAGCSFVFLKQSGVDGAADGRIAALQRSLLLLEPIRYLIRRPVCLRNQPADVLPLLGRAQNMLLPAEKAPLPVATLRF